MPTLLGLFACLFVISAQAQTRTISGKVTDAKDGSPLAGVSVVVKGSKVGAQTAGDGTYRISVSSNATLVFSSVGFGDKEVAVGANSSVNVSLAATNEQLGEVVQVRPVLVGGGLGQRLVVLAHERQVQRGELGLCGQGIGVGMSRSHGSVLQSRS